MLWPLLLKKKPLHMPVARHICRRQKIYPDRIIPVPKVKEGSAIVATMGLTTDEQKAVERFQRNVVAPSMDNLVILDFWAEWCGPCKALTPVLEKVAADYADRGVVLAKINVDEEGFIASQFQVRSIPTVYAIFQGKPVADLTNARAEAQLKAILDQLLSQLPITPGGGAAAQPDIAPLLAMGEEVLAGGDGERAAGIFAQIVDLAPGDASAHGGLIRALCLAGRSDEAGEMLAQLPEGLAGDPAIERARATLTLAQDRPDDAAMTALKAAVSANPDDLQARFDLANALIAARQHDDAADALLHIVAVDRDWQEQAARTRLLALFEMVGLEDPWVAATRRRLSALLFG
jgi:putative thioredoxin